MNSRCAIAAWLECFQEKQSWCRNDHVCQGRKNVKRFERSNVLDSALYKNIPFLPFYQMLCFLNAKNALGRYEKHVHVLT